MGISNIDDHNSCWCGKNPESVDWHSCPYAYEINGNEASDFCQCCSDCQYECSEAI